MVWVISLCYVQEYHFLKMTMSILRFFAELLKKKRKHFIITGKLHCQIIKSIIAERRNKNGLDILKETINCASEDNIILLIAEYGDLIKPMLDRLPQNSSEQIKKIKLLCSRYCHDNSVTGDALTERETQVLMMMASGLSRSEAASEINVSVSTIKRHIETCYRKLGVNNRVSAINEAKKRRMI